MKSKKPCIKCGEEMVEVNDPIVFSLNGKDCSISSPHLICKKCLCVTMTTDQIIEFNKKIDQKAKEDPEYRKNLNKEIEKRARK